MSVRILIIDDDEQFRELLCHHITSEWIDAHIVVHQPSAKGRLPEEFSAAGYDVVVLDNRPAGEDGLEWLRDFGRRPGFPPVIFLTDKGDELLAVQAIKTGAEDYFPKHRIDHDLFINSLRQAIRKRKRQAALLERSRDLDEAYRFGEVKIRGQRFVRIVSSGANSSVYLAESEKRGQLVVLKILRQVPDVEDGKNAFERFIQEYEVISKVKHPNVVRIFDLGVADDHAYIAMEYFPAGDLKKRIRNSMPASKAVAYLKQIAAALAAIHAVGVLHRDLKPANIMLREDDSIALIDFGLAKEMHFQAELTGTGEIFGTPYYMSPEQGHAAHVDERSDIYSLGIIFFEMLTRRKPFIAASPMAVIYKHSHADIPGLPAPIKFYEPLLHKMIAKDPIERFQTMDELIAELDGGQYTAHVSQV